MLLCLVLNEAVLRCKELKPLRDATLASGRRLGKIFWLQAPRPDPVIARLRRISEIEKIDIDFTGLSKASKPAFQKTFAARWRKPLTCQSASPALLPSLWHERRRSRRLRPAG